MQCCFLGPGVFDIYQDPGSLINFLAILITSSETNLGFDKSIKQIGETDFDLKFTIQCMVYHISKLLYDLGAGAATS